MWRCLLSSTSVELCSCRIWAFAAATEAREWELPSKAAIATLLFILVRSLIENYGLLKTLSRLPCILEVPSSALRLAIGASEPTCWMLPIPREATEGLYEII